MRPFMVTGVILLLIGVLALGWAGIVYTSTADPAAHFGVPAFICSGVAIVAGLFMMAMGRASGRTT